MNVALHNQNRLNFNWLQGNIFIIKFSIYIYDFVKLMVTKFFYGFLHIQFVSVPSHICWAHRTFRNAAQAAIHLHPCCAEHVLCVHIYFLWMNIYIVLFPFFLLTICPRFYIYFLQSTFPTRWMSWTVQKGRGGVGGAGQHVYHLPPIPFVCFIICKCRASPAHPFLNPVYTVYFLFFFFWTALATNDGDFEQESAANICGWLCCIGLCVCMSQLTTRWNWVVVCKQVRRQKAFPNLSSFLHIYTI